MSAISTQSLSVTIPSLPKKNDLSAAKTRSLRKRSSEEQTLSEDSESYSTMLGKRKTNDTSTDQLRAENDESQDSNDSILEGDVPEKRVRR